MKLEGIHKRRRQGEVDAYHDTVGRMINSGKPGDEITAFRNLHRQMIDNIAIRVNRIVLWNEPGA